MDKASKVIVDEICIECAQCGTKIQEQEQVLRQFDHTFCSSTCRDKSHANLDYLYKGVGVFTNKGMLGTGFGSLETKAPRGLRRNTSSLSSMSSLGWESFSRRWQSEPKDYISCHFTFARPGLVLPVFPVCLGVSIQNNVPIAKGQWFLLRQCLGMVALR